jgi:prepilin-type N-terminal cleavage/methylation domain-containing protein
MKMVPEVGRTYNLTISRAADHANHAMKGEKEMRKKGFTLVELLVVIAIIAMLLAILMPALNKVRQIAYRMVCGSNLSGLGKACMTYANDYQESYPVLGSSSTVWDPTKQINSAGMKWDTWSGTTFTANQGPSYISDLTVTSDMFLLVKYADVSTGQFVCKATDAKKFELTLVDAVSDTTNVKDVTQVWDFGPNPGSTKQTRPSDFCSYAYQMQHKTSSSATVGPWVLTASTQAGMAIMADKSPWWAKAGTLNPPLSATGPKILTEDDLGTQGMSTGTKTPKKEEIKKANSPNHQQEGQNVLFADAHVSFETQPNVGIEQDNIYTPWANNSPTSLVQKQGGPTTMSSAPSTNMIGQAAEDNFLVN